ncbi:class I SAM-dependent RNA methyltransferase [Halobacteriovorax sp.]|uniref:class I SAM-dependent RNA methyltransferase n=1 Tax=Halobacteriovorax sp. TaxID=2020862 RepID=UPI0035632EE6
MKKVEFNIDHIDPLGQGISKTDEQVCFIEKTLPGETGEIAPIKSKKKGRLIFSRLDLKDLRTKSEHRIEAECKHFYNCSGCHYLHTSYENEIALKHNTAKRMFERIDQLNAQVELISAPERYYYRNRVQLHYDKEEKKLGMIDSLNSKIREVESCMVVNSNISNKLKELYEEDSWLKLVKFEAPKGHIEIYELDSNIQITINKRYAEGGFTQVNEVMNAKMLSHLETQVRSHIPKEVMLLDLFGGAGNLSRNLVEYQTLVIDGFPPTKKDFKEHQTFEEINLYHKNAIDLIKKRADGNEVAIILDPPRSGLKNISELISKLNPTHIFMINCEASSAVRDIKSIEQKFTIEDLTIFDLFPGTRHFETFSTLRFG